jgi:hypothetical protein
MIKSTTTPSLHDPKELHTMILFTIRQLYGDFESYSYDMTVELYDPSSSQQQTQPIHQVWIDHNAQRPAAIDKDDATDTSSNYFLVFCRTESSSAIRASLTLLSPPPYMEEDTLYQLDVLHVHNLLPIG